LALRTTTATPNVPGLSWTPAPKQTLGVVGADVIALVADARSVQLPTMVSLADRRVAREAEALDRDRIGHGHVHEETDRVGRRRRHPEVLQRADAGVDLEEGLRRRDCGERERGECDSNEHGCTRGQTKPAGAW
jgi:hypothetical protein